jgi:hypothetical protein
MLLNLYGALAVTFMMVMYALERRHRGFTAAGRRYEAAKTRATLVCPRHRR